DGWRRVVLLREGCGTQRVDRVSRAGLHVVRKTERVAHFVRRYKADELAHHFVAEFDATCLRIDSGGLNEEPVAEQVHYVVVPTDVGVEDFARTWVGLRWTVSICDRRCEIADHRVTDVLWAEFRIFFWAWRKL